jgi:hypothetical protein
METKPQTFGQEDLLILTGFVYDKRLGLGICAQGGKGVLVFVEGQYSRRDCGVSALSARA